LVEAEVGQVWSPTNARDWCICAGSMPGLSLEREGSCDMGTELWPLQSKWEITKIALNLVC
jgi:hypothetical protein